MDEIDPLKHYPDTYGMVVTRPVNWMDGPMPLEEARLVSKDHAHRAYLVVWEGRTGTVGFRNGIMQWRKAVTDT